MKIKCHPNHSRDLFHKNKPLNDLVDIFLDSEYSFFLEDLAAIFTFSKKDNKFKSLIGLLEKRYSLTNHASIFFKLKHCVYEIYNNEYCDHLRGAFLELLVLKFYSNKFYPTNTEVDTLIEIDGWKSEKTVDVYICCEDSGKIFECKVSLQELSDDIVKNLNDIYIQSKKNIKPNFITLAHKNQFKEHCNNYLSKSNNIINNIIGITFEDLNDFFN